MFNTIFTKLTKDFFPVGDPARQKLILNVVNENPATREVARNLFIHGLKQKSLSARAQTELDFVQSAAIEAGPPGVLLQLDPVKLATYLSERETAFKSLFSEAEQTEISNIDLVMNLQGDEPLIDVDDIRNLNKLMIKI